MLGGAARRIAAHAARRLTSTASAPRATTPCATLLDATRFRTHRAATRWTAARAFASSPTTASAIADLRRHSAEAEGAGEKTTGASDAAVAPRRARVHAAAAHRPRALTVDELKAALAAGARATRRPLELWAGIVDWTTPGRRERVVAARRLREWRFAANSTKLKRRLKMNKHKHRKRRKRDRLKNK